MSAYEQQPLHQPLPDDLSALYEPTMDDDEPVIGDKAPYRVPDEPGGSASNPDAYLNKGQFDIRFQEKTGWRTTLICKKVFANAMHYEEGIAFVADRRAKYMAARKAGRAMQRKSGYKRTFVGGTSGSQGSYFGKIPAMPDLNYDSMEGYLQQKKKREDAADAMDYMAGKKAGYEVRFNPLEPGYVGHGSRLDKSRKLLLKSGIGQVTGNFCLPDNQCR